MTKRKRANVPLAQIKMSGYRHERLTDEQLARVRTITDILCAPGEGGEAGSFDDYVDGFKRDMHPDREIAMWEHIALTYRAYTEQHPALGKTARREVLENLTMLSLGQSARVGSLGEAAAADLRALFHRLAADHGVH